MKIAHVSSDDIGLPEIAFHLNISTNERIPRPGAKVWASADNGYCGEIYTITYVVSYHRFHLDKSARNFTPFVSVDYIATKKGE